MTKTFYKIKWKSDNPIIDNINSENFIHKYEFCIEYTNKNCSEEDCILSKYNPVIIIKYPININKKKNISNGHILLNSTEFNKMMISYNITNIYLTQVTHYSNNELKIKKIKINSTCMYTECNLFENITKYKELSMTLDINCKDNISNCNFATLSKIK